MSQMAREPKSETSSLFVNLYALVNSYSSKDCIMYNFCQVIFMFFMLEHMLLYSDLHVHDEHSI